MDKTIRKEVGFKEWLSKVTERCNIVLFSLKEKTEIKEDDWDILRELHGLYFKGHIPILHNIPVHIDEEMEKMSQANLFSGSSVSNNSDGTVVEPPKAETKTKKIK